MSGWVGCDLDGTLAEHTEGADVETIGPPIPAMVERVRAWLTQGIDVRIVTARMGTSVPLNEKVRQYNMIAKWCHEHIGRPLHAQACKDFGMIELWDDRAVQVVRNTGLRADQVATDTVTGAILTWLVEEFDGASPAAKSTADFIMRGIARGAWK